MTAPVEPTCPDCDGTGGAIGQPCATNDCSTCDGQGVVRPPAPVEPMTAADLDQAIEMLAVCFRSHSGSPIDHEVRDKKGVEVARVRAGIDALRAEVAQVTAKLLEWKALAIANRERHDTADAAWEKLLGERDATIAAQAKVIAAASPADVSMAEALAGILRTFEDGFCPWCHAVDDDSHDDTCAYGIAAQVFAAYDAARAALETP